MLTVRRTAGDLQSVIAAIPNVPRRVIPYAASTALTRVAKHAATTVLPAEMRKSFSNPTYAPALDFTGTVQSVALDRFRPEFERAVADMLSKGGKGASA